MVLEQMQHHRLQCRRRLSISRIDVQSHLKKARTWSAVQRGLNAVAIASILPGGRTHHDGPLPVLRLLPHERPLAVVKHLVAHLLLFARQTVQELPVRRRFLKHLQQQAMSQLVTITVMKLTNVVVIC